MIKFLLFFIIIPLLTGCNKTPERETINKDVLKKPEIPIEPVKTTITMSASGDCTIGTDDDFGYYNHFNYWFDKKVNKDYNYFFNGVKDVFENDDYTFVNFEGTFTTSNKKVDKAYNFKGDPSYVNILLNGSIEGVNFANNHVNDYGLTGYNDTINTFKENNIDFWGYEHLNIKEIKGIKVGFAGYDFVGMWASKDKDVVAGINKLKEQGAQLIIVTVHFGQEYNPNITKNQKKIAHLAIDNGADLVIGHHPHIIQGIEYYKGRYIAYSLGNFVFGGNSNPRTKDSMIVRPSFSFEDNVLVETKLEIIPVSISSVTNRNDYQPTILEGKAKQKIIDLINSYSKNLNFYYEESVITNDQT